MTFTAEQTYIPGTEPPGETKIPAVEFALHEWLEAKHEQKNASETTKIKHASLLAALTEAKLESYLFIDADGKKRRAWVAKEPKAKTTAVPKPRGEKRRRKRGGAERDDAVVDPNEVIEVRRVKRTAKHDVMADPFGSTRAGMGEAFNPPKLQTRTKAKRGK